jgi:hypothetical protein
MLSHDLAFGRPWIGTRRTLLWDECSIRGTNFAHKQGNTPIPCWFSNAEDLLGGAQRRRRGGLDRQAGKALVSPPVLPVLS